MIKSHQRANHYRCCLLWNLSNWDIFKWYRIIGGGHKIGKAVRVISRALKNKEKHYYDTIYVF